MSSIFSSDKNRCEYYTYSNITIYSTIEWCWHGTNNTAIKIGVPAHPTITKEGCVNTQMKEVK